MFKIKKKIQHTINSNDNPPSQQRRSKAVCSTHMMNLPIVNNIKWLRTFAYKFKLLLCND